MARLTGLEPATPGVTGRDSNQLSYNRSRRPVRYVAASQSVPRRRPVGSAGLIFGRAEVVKGSRKKIGAGITKRSGNL